MPKINRGEYKALKKMQKKGHKFIARGKEGHVIVFTAYHGKSENRWLVTTNRDDYKYESLYNSDEIFLFIGWEDEEPHNIAELIGEYVVEEIRRSYFGPKFPRVNGFYNANLATWVGLNESEETEVKNIEELKSWFEDDKLYVGEYVKHKINQLDEPETVEQTTHLLESVLRENKRLGKLLEEKHEEWFELMDEINNQETLSEYWIEQKSIDTHVDTLNREVQVTFRLDDLENLLVPRQELPVIPKFVADLLEEYKAKEPVITFYGFIKTVTNLGFKDNHSEEGKFTRWLTNKNEELLMRAWLDGYEVEEEQKLSRRI